MRDSDKNEFFRVKVDLPSFQLDVSTKNADSALPELRKILELVSLDEDIIYEEFVTEELKTTFSQTFIANSQVMTAVKSLLKQEDDYRVSSIEIPSSHTLDLENQTRGVKVEKRDIQRAITSLTQDIEEKRVKQGIVHISGKLDRDGKVLIIDHIHKHMPTAQLRAFQSNTSGTKIMVECVFFGDFPE